MKIRTDYVSNSSSSSFCLKKGVVEKALKRFFEDFQSSFNNTDFYNFYELRVTIRYSNNDDWDYLTFEEFIDRLSRSGNESSSSSADNNDEENPVIDFDSVEHISFSTEEYNKNMVFVLRTLYLYFEKLGFNPDATYSEMDFLSENKLSFLSMVVDKIRCD